MCPPDHHLLPCLNCQPQSFVRMVQHLIERCLLLRMSRDDCIKALAQHARIQPLVTLTVWKELLKENRDFFQAYYHAMSSRRMYRRPVRRIQRFRGSRNPWKLIRRNQTNEHVY